MLRGSLCHIPASVMRFSLSPISLFFSLKFYSGGGERKMGGIRRKEVKGTENIKKVKKIAML